ncbi:hypothetical protein H6F67_03275 [Microcoleus sp. FACHB-1515]|uniref:hypothetical protein n=1 Tax=Cyanophyceae TaxID=3028117 RepID=UPI0016894BE1|nr:hypothetical protein [Microcoleus sp. FACHB-1515]MBD2088875.1 hypothetical protein [Microcoleus sp. FACHB-1515]
MSNSLRPGNSLRKALPVRFAYETALSDRIGANNKNDFFAFRVNVRSSFRGRLVNAQKNIGFHLLDRNGQVLQTSTRTGARSQSIRLDVEAGDYYVQVFSTNPRSKTYQLRLFKEELWCGCGDEDEASRSRSTPRSLFT